MGKIVMDADLRAKLNGGTESLEVQDEDGNLVGRYWPLGAFARIAEAFLKPLTKEEIAEARREMLETGGVSTAEMLDALADAKRAWEAAQ